jgi:hypothetical protein
MPTLTKMIGRTPTAQICHPERSASKIFPKDSDRREVEGPREYLNLRKRFKAFSREFPFAVYAIEASPGCFDSHSLAFALTQHDRREEFE